MVSLPKQTMWKLGLGVLLLGVALAFAIVPDLRAWIVALSPAVLLLLLCPLMMYVCMKMMHEDKPDRTSGSGATDKSAAAQTGTEQKKG